MATSESTSGRNPIDRLAEEFVDRQRRGEQPSLNEYIDRYPALAEEIRDLFPALDVMERLKPGPRSVTGSVGGPATPSDPAAESRRSGRLGDYRLLREVGRGGMGIVYEAVEESLGRHVALTVLAPQGRLDRTKLTRFRREARAAARLHHAHIVPVFGVGERDGVPYYAMQFIQGQGLDEILRDLKRLRNQGPRLAGPGPADLSVSTAAWRLLTGEHPASPVAAGAPPTNDQAGPASPAPAGSPESPASGDHSSLASLPESRYFQSVARIGARVAGALAYAHGQGILHRDVKPSNLLLDVRGTSGSPTSAWPRPMKAMP
jgi:serine/threonine protein kinase